jgi:hypothetical protein
MVSGQGSCAAGRLLFASGLAATMVLASSAGASDDSVDVLAGQVSAFSQSGGSLPEGWQPLTFPKVPRHTDYQLIRETEDGPWVMQATSDNAGSGLIHKVAIDLKTNPIMRVAWKVESVLAKGDARKKQTDDYPARVYLIFDPPMEDLSYWERAKLSLARSIFGDVPGRAINYFWASTVPKGAVFGSAYAGDFIKLIALESGDANAGRWQVEERDVFEDYRELFGTEPPALVAVAVMTDTDNTHERVRAWYGDIEFIERSER